MRFVLLAAISACGFSNTIDPGAATTRTILDDTRADFQAGRVVDGVITEGSIEPDGFILYGLYARGFQAGLVDPGEDFTKVLADATAVTQAGTAYAQLPTDWIGARPRGLGLGANDVFSVLWDGEILLPKGQVTLEANVDDRGLVQVAPDGMTFGDLLAASTPGAHSITLTVSDAGWYPIRAAMTEDSGNARLALTIVQNGARTPVDGNRLRSRVTNDRGLVVYVFDGQGFVGPQGHVARLSADQAFGGGAPPYDLTGSFDYFSLRFAGQLRIDTSGEYTFSALHGADDGWRLWIDGKLVAHHWLGHPDVPSATTNLTAGWHSIVVDYADEIGNAEIHVSMLGPDAPNGGVIDPARLRPVVLHGNTVTFATRDSATIQDATLTQLPLPLGGNNLTLIDSVDYGFRIGNQEMSTLTVDLLDCNGTKPLNVTTNGYHYFPADSSCAGKPTNPTVDWALRFTDTTIGNGFFIGLGNVSDYGVTALYRGGPNMPFATAVTYMSNPRATPGATRIDSARALGTFDGAVVELEVRTGADEASLVASPFELVHDGQQIAAPGAELIQYRVTMTTNGWQFPSLDKVEIVYVVDGAAP